MRLLASHVLDGLLSFGEVLRLHVRDMKETVPAEPEVNKGRLYGWLDVYDASLVDIAYVRSMLVRST